MMKNFLKSFKYAFEGILSAFALERNLKVQVIIAALTIGAGFYFKISPIEWCVIILAIGLVLSMELVNTAIENVVNMITTERKPLAGKIKDIAAGAVLIVSIVAVLVGIFVFRKYLL